MRSSATVAVVAVALALGVAATEPADSPTEPAHTEPGGGEPPADLEFEIDVLLGVVPPEEAEEHRTAILEEEQHRIQDCMAAAGFEYELELQPSPAADPTAELTDVEFAEQWGFGIYTLLAPDAAAELDVIEEYTWPNEDVVDALGPDERDAWFDALNACTAEISAGGDAWNNPMLADVFDGFFAMVDADPRVVDALAAFGACMEEAGYAVERPDDAYELVWDPELLEQFWVTAAWEPDSIDHDIWLEAVALEIDTAVAAATCAPLYLVVRDEVAVEQRDDLVAAVEAIDWTLDPFIDDGFDAEGEAVVPDTEPDA